MASTFNSMRDLLGHPIVSLKLWNHHRPMQCLFHQQYLVTFNVFATSRLQSFCLVTNYMEEYFGIHIEIKNVGVEF